MLDSMEARICATQADVFEWGAKNKYRFPDFANLYLATDFCARSMDGIYSTFQLREPLEHMDFIRKERPDVDSLICDEVYATDAAYWIGYMYRALFYETGKKSLEVLKEYPFEKMERLYPGLHTLDYNMAVDVILRRVMLEYEGVEYYVAEEKMELYRKVHKKPLDESSVCALVIQYKRDNPNSELTSTALSNIVEDFLQKTSQNKKIISV